MESNLNPNAVVAVDVVVFTLRPASAIEDRWQVLLVRRDEPAFGDKLVPARRPGARRRDLRRRRPPRRCRPRPASTPATGISNSSAPSATPGRDTRGRVVSVAHVALVAQRRRRPGARQRHPLHRLGARARPARRDARLRPRRHAARGHQPRAGQAALFLGRLPAAAGRVHRCPSCARSTRPSSTRRWCA